MKVGFIVLRFVRQVSVFSLFSGIRTRDLYRVTIEFFVEISRFEIGARKACVTCAMLQEFAREHFF